MTNQTKSLPRTKLTTRPPLDLSDSASDPFSEDLNFSDEEDKPSEDFNDVILRRTSLRSKSEIHLPDRYKDDDLSSNSYQARTTQGSKDIKASKITARRQTKRKCGHLNISDLEVSNEGVDISGNQADDEAEDLSDDHHTHKRTRNGQGAGKRPSYGGKTYPPITIGGKTYPRHVLAGKTIPQKISSQATTPTNAAGSYFQAGDSAM